VQAQSLAQVLAVPSAGSTSMAAISRSVTLGSPSLRARGSDWSWLTPKEAAELAREWMERYSTT
jgi:hypothetical protein